jgi:hypothetical protein
MGLKGYASLNHFNGPEGWIKHIAASAGDKRQKRRTWVSSALSGGSFEKKGTVGYLNRWNCPLITLQD